MLDKLKTLFTPHRSIFALSIWMLSCFIFVGLLFLLNFSTNSEMEIFILYTILISVLIGIISFIFFCIGFSLHYRKFRYITLSIFTLLFLGIVGLIGLSYLTETEIQEMKEVEDTKDSLTSITDIARGRSMEPTIYDGDTLLRDSTKLSEYNPGDIVSFECLAKKMS